MDVSAPKRNMFHLNKLGSWVITHIFTIFNLPISFSINHVVHEMSENSERFLPLFSRAQNDVFRLTWEYLDLFT